MAVGGPAPAQRLKHALAIVETKRFQVLVSSRQDEKPTLPVLSVMALFLSQRRSSNCDANVPTKLFQALRDFGFCFLTLPKQETAAGGTTSAAIRASTILSQLHSSLHQDLFPDSPETHSHLSTSDNIYVSERGVPMYKLGYELSEDKVREMFRIAAGRPDDPVWPCDTVKEDWLRGLGFMRHVCDTALDLLLPLVAQDNDENQRQPRPYSGSAAWTKDSYATSSSLQERRGDYSVLYAMHYFNQQQQSAVCPQPGIAVKAHVDPSLLVLEPFLCHHTKGLQVWDRQHEAWMDCDGPQSPAAVLQHAEGGNNQHVLLLFVGQALAEVLSIEPTLHRVVAGDQPRCTIIYEQKYEEFFPAPRLD